MTSKDVNQIGLILVLLAGAVDWPPAARLWNTVVRCMVFVNNAIVSSFVALAHWGRSLLRQRG